jgi:hypothetical protein
MAIGAASITQKWCVAASSHKDKATTAKTMGGSNANKGWNTRTWGCGMAKLVYCNDSNLCENNYYYALATEFVSNPPNSLPAYHIGITDSCANDFYFAPDAPVTNYKPHTPTIGVHMANSCIKCSVASATLALAPSLPSTAMAG